VPAEEPRPAEEPPAAEEPRAAEERAAPPRLESVPPVAPSPPVSFPPPPPAPPRREEPPVVTLRPRFAGQPREWNLWELERLAREASRQQPERFEEWSYLFLYLRQYATAEGVLPAEFDGLVRDAFGRLLERSSAG
jgi:hypothetical protein